MQSITVESICHTVFLLFVFSILLSHFFKFFAVHHYNMPTFCAFKLKICSCAQNFPFVIAARVDFFGFYFVSYFHIYAFYIFDYNKNGFYLQYILPLYTRGQIKKSQVYLALIYFIVEELGHLCLDELFFRRRLYSHLRH